MGPVSVLIDIDDVNRRITKEEDVSPAELREWIRSRGDLGPIGGVKRESYHSVLRRYRMGYMEKASDIAEASGASLTADEQRRINREMANVGEVSTLMLEMGEPETEHDRLLAERYPNGKSRTLELLSRSGSSSQREEKLWLPSGSEYKAQSIGSDSGGGYLVPVTNLSGFFEDRLRPASAFLSANPRVVKMQTERVNLPKLGSSVTIANYGESALISSSDVAIETVGLSLTKFATRTVASSEVLADASPDLRAIVQRDHELSLASEIDRQLLAGTGVSGQLLGLRHQTGITTTTLGSGNGATPTLGDVSDALYRLEAANAKASAIFCSPRTWNTLRQLQDLQDRYQLAPDPTEAARRQLFGVPVFTSSQISNTETAGSSGAVCSFIAIADMSRIVVGQRDQVNVLFDPFSLSSTDQIVIRSTTRWGIALLDEEAVQIVAGVKAS